MNGILLINKEKGYTSRDVVNIVSKILGTKKIGHTGTLDPLATGLLVLCVGQGLKLVELLTGHDKEYIATIKLGIETDTLDITGNITSQKEVSDLTKDTIKQVLKQFLGPQKQEVPKYSAIKVNGKKLYEYARKNQEVVLPVHDITIHQLDLISDIEDNTFTIRCSVSKGTYIRSLVRDIGYALGTVATMTELKRTKVGQFSLENTYTLEELQNNNFQLLAIQEVLDLPQIIVDQQLEKKIANGQVLPKFFQEEMVLLLNQSKQPLAIYQQKDANFVKPYRMFVS